MTGLNHGLTGAAIALLVKQPAAAVPLAFLSHFATDLLPHWNYNSSSGSHFDKRFNITLIGDFVLSVCLMFVLAILFPSQKYIIWACMIAAACPDLMWSYYFLYIERIKGRKPKLDLLARFHSFIQWSQTPRGLYVEVAWFIAVSSLILNLR